ncbi:MAG: SpoIIE family protein phosphatase [Acidobacteriota bacterium]
MSDSAPSSRRRTIGLALLAFTVLLATVDPPVLGFLARFSLVALALVLLSWGFFRLMRRLLWSVGRRLTFSYLLIGALPIPMILIIGLVGTYLLSGLFLGHLFRGALFELYRETATLGRAAAPGFSDPEGHIEVAWYQDGVRTSGTDLAPDAFPTWLEEETRYILDPENRAQGPPLVALDDGRLALAAAFLDEEGGGRVAIFSDSLEGALRGRTSAWVELLRSDDPRLEPALTLEVFDETYFLVPPQFDASERRAFLEAAGLPEEDFGIVGFERCGAVYALGDGQLAIPSVSANLYGQPETILRNLFSSASKIDSLALFAFVFPAFLLFDVYVMALLMAIFIIFSMTRAVNRLSKGTEAVASGDFSARIPVRRSDQIGELQSSFNDMTANLEDLVEQSAQKEVLDKELEIAQELQTSLVPDEEIQVPGAEFSTFFEPSLAIGGDYFDIVRLREDQERLAVVIADVAGHGLPAGLRMAMLKAAVQVLVSERKEPEGILQALDEIVRSGPNRAFVTATLSLIDLKNGTAEILNAGHTPVYHLNGTGAREILLPSLPLGTFDQRFARTSIQLQPGDALVWLSDGLIEATNDRDEAFGFERLQQTLSQAPRDGALSLRHAVTEAVGQHAGGRPADDDRSLVVMRYVEEPDAPTSEG